MSSQTTTGDYVKNILLNNNISPTINATNINGYDLVIQASSILKANIIADNITSIFREKIGFTMDTMLISCYFNGIKCNSSDFVHSQSYEYGNCYSFNSDLKSVRYTSKYGPTSGLNLELFVGVGGNYYLKLKDLLRF